MRTYYTVKCPCGNTGTIQLSENDAPFSACYESYAIVDGMNGNGYRTDKSTHWTEVFEHMNPTCDSCGTALTPANITD
jgi:hypothetical protein